MLGTHVDTVVPVATIAVLSNVAPPDAVITVDEGIVTLSEVVPEVGANTTSVVPVIVREIALVVVPDMVATVERVPPVTTTDTEPLVESDPVDSWEVGPEAPAS